MSEAPETPEAEAPDAEVSPAPPPAAAPDDADDLRGYHFRRLIGKPVTLVLIAIFTIAAGVACAIFIGAHTPEAIGDYIAGSNHVLPTARSARFSSGLGVLDFMKRTSLLKCGPEQLRALGPAAIALGEAEGLSAHARSVAIRLNQR